MYIGGDKNMDISSIVLMITCAFSGISIIISVFNLITTKNISQDERYINTITNARKNWEDNIKRDSSCFFSLVDTIFLFPKDKAVDKFEELLKHEYSMEITLYDYADDIEIKRKMQEIQHIIYDYLSTNDVEISADAKAKIDELKSELFVILNKKVEREWNKQKEEVAGVKYLPKIKERRK